MTQAETFYLAQAANCGIAAADSTLENQRNKFLHAQAAWEALANASAKAQAEKTKRDERRASEAAEVI